MSGAAATSWRPLVRLLRRARALCTGVIEASLGDLANPSTLARISIVVEDLEALLRETNPYDAHSVWSLIGKDHLAGLVTLFGLALRRSAVAANASRSEREVFSSLRAVLAAHLGHLLEARRIFRVEAEPYSLIAEALVRTQAIRCYAQLLSDFASPLISPVPEPCPPRVAAAALAALREALILLEVLTYYDCKALQTCTRKKIYDYRVMLEELEESSMLGHWSRTLLLLMPRAKGALLDEAAGLLPRLAPVMESGFFRSGSGLATADRSLVWLMTLHLVGLAAALDGGTTYGIRAAGPGAVAPPLVNAAGRRLKPHSLDPYVDTRLARCVLSKWSSRLGGMAGHLQQPDGPPSALPVRELGRRLLLELPARLVELEAMRADDGVKREEECFHKQDALRFVEDLMAGWPLPPFRVAATRDVSMRLAACATEALVEAAAADAAQDGASSTTAAAAAAAQQELQRQRLRLAPKEAAKLGLQALKCARAALWDVGWATEAEHPPEKLEQLQGWWGLAARIASLAAIPRPDPADGGGWRRAAVEELMPLRAQKSAGAVASEPSADVAAALRVGYPQLMELLMRRPATVSDAKDCVEMFNSSMSDIEPDAWAQTLTFADPRATASLLATMAKAARRATMKLNAAAASARAAFAEAGISASIFTRDNLPQFDNDPSLRRSSDNAYMALEYVRGAVQCVTLVLNPYYGPALFIDRLRSAAAAAAAASSTADSSEELEPRTQASSRSSRGDEAGGVGSDDDGKRASGSGGGSDGGGDAVAGSSADGPDEDDANGRLQSGAAGPGRPSDDEAEAAALAPGRQGSDPQVGAKRLAAALSQVAVRLLPELTRLAASVAASCGSNYNSVWVDSRCLTAAISWVPLLAAAAAAGARDGNAAPQDGSGCEGVPAAQATVAAAAAEWDRLLWVDVGLPKLLGLGLGLLEVSRTLKIGRSVHLEEAWADALRALVHLAPKRLAKAITSRGKASVAAAEAADAAGATPAALRAAAAPWPEAAVISLVRLRAALRPEGVMPNAELLATLERLCTVEGTAMPAALPATGDAASLSSRGGAADPPGPLPEELRQWVAAAALLVPPGEVRAALPACDNPGCTNLEGDSEAGLRLSGCGRCGGRVRYCCRECQVAHWKAGHKDECGGMTGGASAMAASAPASAVGSTSS